MTDEEKIKELKKEHCPKCANKELCESNTPFIKHCFDRRDGSIRDKPKWFKMSEDEANVKAEEYCRNTCIWRGMGKCFDNCKSCLVYKIFLDGYWVGRKESERK